MTYKDIFPPIETVLELEPEELAPFVLRFLATRENINRYNFTLGTDPDIIKYAGTKVEELCHRLMEAWMWLEKELFVAPKPGQQGDWAFITMRGKKVLENQDFATYRMASLLPSEGLDPILVRKVKAAYIRGDYDTAVFQAFKEVEVRVRERGCYDASDFGVSLMRKAYHPDTGHLTDKKALFQEREAMMHLFSGAIGLFKNPSSHRDVDFTNPTEVADMIHVANQLLRIAERAEKTT